MDTPRDLASRVLQLRPRNFVYREREHWGQQTGLVAEEVNEVLPELVIKDGDGIPETIRYHELAVYVLAAVRELAAKVDMLTSQSRDA
jgi:hypothetical protein